MTLHHFHLCSNTSRRLMFSFTDVIHFMFTVEMFDSYKEEHWEFLILPFSQVLKGTSGLKRTLHFFSEHSLFTFIERWNSITVTNSLPPVPMTGSKKAVHVLLCLCNNACKRFLAICVRVGHRVPWAGFCLSLYSLHVLNRDVNMIQTNKQTNLAVILSIQFCYFKLL